MLKRIVIDRDPFLQWHGYYRSDMPYCDAHLMWDASWLGTNTPPEASPQITVYRLDFELAKTEIVRLHISGAERYDFYCDGTRIDGGPERGDFLHWAYASFEGELAAGKHRFSARVWSAPGRSPDNQLAAANRFLLAAEGELAELLSTGKGKWECCAVSGVSFPVPSLFPWRVLDECRFDLEKYDHLFDMGEKGDFAAALVLERGISFQECGQLADRFLLMPSQLPPMMRQKVSGMTALMTDDGSEERFFNKNNIAADNEAAQSLLSGSGVLRVKAGERRRVLADLGSYYCYFAGVTLSGRGTLRIVSAESLFTGNGGEKGRRREYEGKLMRDVHYDEYIAAGRSCHVEPLHYRAGIYMILELSASDEADLVLEKIELTETRYPLEIKGKFSASDPFFAAIEPLMVRVAQMCMHEVYFDCPFYEQMMYVGDTRLQALMTYVLSGDARLPQRALRLFSWSASYQGMTASRYPDNIRQVIPSFSLIWVRMLCDMMMWSGDIAAVRELRHTAHAILDWFENYRRPDGLVESIPGWNFVDWVDVRSADGSFLSPSARWCNIGKEAKWDGGVPPGGAAGEASCVLNLIYVYALEAAARIEHYCGEKALEQLFEDRRKLSLEAVNARFWSESAGAYSDDVGGKHFSEHSQILAVITGAAEGKRLESVQKFLYDDDTVPRGMVTVSFANYYFESCRMSGRIDKFMQKQRRIWEQYLDLQLSTVVECNEPARSDCHAWGGHPMVHWRTLLLGIIPAAPGFARVEVKPQPGELEYVSGVLPTVRGEIYAEWHQSNGRLTGVVTLPDGVAGEFVAPDGSRTEFTGRFEIN